MSSCQPLLFQVKEGGGKRLRTTCYCGRVIRMQSGCEDKWEDLYAIRLCIKLRENATKMYKN